MRFETTFGGGIAEQVAALAIASHVLRSGTAEHCNIDGVVWWFAVSPRDSRASVERGSRSRRYGREGASRAIASRKSISILRLGFVSWIRPAPKGPGRRRSDSRVTSTTFSSRSTCFTTVGQSVDSFFAGATGRDRIPLGVSVSPRGTETSNNITRSLKWLDRGVDRRALLFHGKNKRRFLEFTDRSWTHIGSALWKNRIPLYNPLIRFVDRTEISIPPRLGRLAN